MASSSRNTNKRSGFTLGIVKPLEDWPKSNDKGDKDEDMGDDGIIMANSGERTLVVVCGLTNYTRVAASCKELNFDFVRPDPPTLPWPDHPNQKLVPDCMNHSFTEFQSHLLRYAKAQIEEVLKNNNTRVVVTTSSAESTVYPFIKWYAEKNGQDFDALVAEMHVVFEEWRTFIQREFQHRVFVIQGFVGDYKKSVAEQVAKGSPPMPDAQADAYFKMYTNELLNHLKSENSSATEIVFAKDVQRSLTSYLEMAASGSERKQ